MPSYLYICKYDHVSYDFATVAEMKQAIRCKRRGCRALAKRLLGAHVAPSGNWPMTSDAAGVDASQVKEAYEHSVKMGIPTEFTSEGSAVFRSPKHRRDYCEAIGMHDRDGGYGDPQPNSTRTRDE